MAFDKKDININIFNININKINSNINNINININFCNPGFSPVAATLPGPS